MADQSLAETAKQAVSNPPTAGFAQLLFMFVGSALASALLTKEPFDWRKFFGEMLIAVMGAIAVWHMGILQQLSPSAIIVIGFSTSLGMFRQLTWASRLFKLLPVKLKWDGK